MNEIREKNTAGEVFALAHKYDQSLNIKAMEFVLREKFRDKKLREKLLDTGRLPL
ncbi:18673_t:CDS:2, partial [Funneliformis geosporum]